jgi:hypothetical protein
MTDRPLSRASRLRGRSAVAVLTAPCLAMALCAAAPAPSPTLDDPEATVVSELVVQAKAAGPAWWRVSRGESTVWVMGVPAGLPRGVQWDTHLLAVHLTGARHLIVPPAYTAGVGDIFGAFALRGKLKSGAPIEASLPEDLRARFVAGAAALSQRPEHYDGWKPAVAGLLMVADFRKRARIQDNQPLAETRNQASRKGVKVSPAASYKALPFLKSLAGDLTEQVNQTCLADSLQEIEAGQGRVRAAAEAWATGDVRGALTAERGYEKCLASFPEFTAQVRRTMADEAAAISRELQNPGVSVAVIPLRMLVARDGVLAQLGARGYEVRTPASE